MKRRNISKSIAQQGGLMIEALAMLGLIAVVTPTMYKKSAERTMEVEDINTASTIRTIMNAANDYVGANYSTIIADMGETQETRPVTPDQIKDYLPYKFDVAKALYNYGNPEITIVKQGNNLTTFALFPANADIGQERTSRIASLIGASGGYVTEAGKARGIGGIWKLEGSDYTSAFPNSGNGAAEYSIVTASADTINAATGNEIDMDKYLQRGRDNTDDPNDRSTWWKNTMRTDLYMGNVENTNDVYNSQPATNTYSIRNIKSLIVGAENATADGSADDNSDYGLYISDGGNKPNAFIQGSITAAEQSFRADATRLGFGRFVDADGANEDFHFNVDANGNTRADGSLTNLMDVDLASKLNDAGTGPAWSDVKIGALGTQYRGADSYLIKGDHAHNPKGMLSLINENLASFQMPDNDNKDDGRAQANSIIFMNDGYTKVNGRFVSGSTTVSYSNNVTAPSYEVTQYFPVNIESNAIVKGLLAAGQLDTQKIRAASLNVGSDKIDSQRQWMQVDANGLVVADPVNGNSGANNITQLSNSRLAVKSDVIALKIDNSPKNIEATTSGETSKHAAQVVLNKGGTDGKGAGVDANIKITAPVTDIRGTTDMTISGKGTLIQALKESDFGTEDNFKNNLSENTIKLRNSDMQATMEGKQLTIEGRNDDTDVRTLFNKGSVDLDSANFNIGSFEDIPGYNNRYNPERYVFSVRANSNPGSTSYQNRFNYQAIPQLGYIQPYDIAMHGNVIIGNSPSGTFAKDAAGGGYSQYHVSIGQFNKKAGINIVPRSFADEENENYENIVYIDQGGASGDKNTTDTSNLNNQRYADNGTIYIRKGYVEVKNDSYSDKKDLNADQGNGVISASRFVANNPTGGDSISDGSGTYSVQGAKFPNMLTGDDKFNKYNGSHNVRYDTYMVNPAYTSVMHDIKLTTRGGARLSDVLPDFINKGIYVVNNTISEDRAKNFNFDSDENEYSTAKGLDQDLDKKTYDMSLAESWASPFMGVVPAPQCPPGYSRVITLTPASFEMGQAGLLRQGQESRYFISPDTPSANLASQMVVSENIPRFEHTDVEGSVQVTTSNGTDRATIGAGSGTNGTLTTSKYVLQVGTSEKPTAPLMFQQSTRLKSLVKPLKAGSGSEYQQGWSAIMGFLYPGKMYSAFGAGNDDNLYWNVFPVIRGTMEAYATVYCYFNRTNINFTKNSDPTFQNGWTNYIDNYSYMQDMTGKGTPVKDASESYLNRLNDPALKYNEAW